MSGTEGPCSEAEGGLPADIVGQAAAILGVGDDGVGEERRAHAPHLAAVRVVGPHAKKVVRVPSDVPVRELGEAAGVGA